MFVHAIGDDCRQLPRPDAFPPDWSGRQQALRAYDRRGWIVAATVSPPGEHDTTIDRLLAGDGVDHVRSHNVAHGCFMLVARTAGAAGP